MTKRREMVGNATINNEYSTQKYARPSRRKQERASVKKQPRDHTRNDHGIKKRKLGQDRSISHLVIIFKKGHKKGLKNYKPICLLSNIHKERTKLLTKSPEKTLDENQPREQTGFSNRYSTTYLRRKPTEGEAQRKYPPLYPIRQQRESLRLIAN